MKWKEPMQEVVKTTKISIKKPQSETNTSTSLCKELGVTTSKRQANIFKILFEIAPMLVMIFSILNCFSPNTLHAEITTDQAIQAIIGEAAGESFKGKIALAEALRNRASLSGVYGYQRKHFIQKQMPFVGEEARKAWQASKYTNLVKGADHWESIDFKTPDWAKDMKETARIGKHRFFKKVQA